ncbi:MAG: hypothetical protein BMS9Abin08_0272 [Gammaproteobacteria bacterium]|nr:MAG: hypothetical protein BMS9Abin08_0272 [Gammaproteobacteria bacterium]
MKMRSLFTISILVSGLLTGINTVSAGQQRTFGFFGEVDSFDRGEQLLVIDDQVFRLSDSVRVHKKKGQQATLSAIRPGVKVGFYPKQRGESRRNSYIDAIWVLPENWKAKRGYADNFDDR